MDVIKVSGKTLDDALTEALIQLGTTSDKVTYEIVEKGSEGFFGIGRKPWTLEVSLKKEEAPEKAPAPAPSPAKEEKAPVQEKKAPVQEKKVSVKKEEPVPARKPEKKAPAKQKPVKKETPAPAKGQEASPAKEEESSEKAVRDNKKAEENVKGFLADVFKAMNMPIEIKTSLDATGRQLDIELVGEDMGVLIGKRGQTLDSLQYLTSLVANRDSDGYVRVKLDTENYRKRRKATLENLAKNMAYKVKRTRKDVTLEPMNPYERRVIHAALQKDRYVETHSEGDEPYRRVVISLKKNSYNDNKVN